MQKLPTFDSAKHEFTYFAVITMKNAMAVEAIENRLNIVAERINELIDRHSSVDLEGFKARFLSDLETTLTQDIELSDEASDLNLRDRFNLLELQIEALTQRVSEIETTLGCKKVSENEKPNIFDLLV